MGSNFRSYFALDLYPQTCYDIRMPQLNLKVFDVDITDPTRLRLGNRSALKWVIDQYRVKTDKRSGIVNDPNRADHPQYIVDLIARVITVSLKTMDIVKNLPAL